MDAPALPPSQSQVPALVSLLEVNEVQEESADIVPQMMPDGQPEHLARKPHLIEALSKKALLSVRALDFDLLTQPKAPTHPLGWLPSTQLAHSFGFMSRAFRSAQLDSALRFSQISSTIPIQWAHGNDWKSWAKAAKIQIAPIDVNDQTARNENAAWVAPFVAQCLLSDKRELSESTIYRLSLKDTTLGYVADRDQAYLLAQQLEQLLNQANFEADEIVPQAVSNQRSKVRLSGFSAAELSVSEFSISAASRRLFSVNESMAEAVGYSKEWAAIAWANNLRIALETEPLKAGEAQMALKGMAPSEITLEGDASWYGPYFHGRATANGETYNQHDLTVAHKSLPFGTHLKVRNLENDRTVVVRVNDRGPYVGDRSLDLSNAAAKCLGSDEAGVIPYEAVILTKAK